MKKITCFLFLISCVSFAQEYTYIDFGITTNTTPGNWNNVAVANAADATGIILGLIDSNGISTGVTLTVDDAFDTVNTAGTTTPDPSIPFPSTASADSFFGETVVFNGTTEPTGGFTLTGLNPAKYYSFSIFASRNTVNDNRETRYTLVGATTLIADLNTSNNTVNTAEIVNIQPKANGEIVFTAQPGPNNNNSSGFYYLGAIEMIASDTQLSSNDFQLKNVLSLYPNPVNDFFEIKLKLESDSNLKIDFYDINGRLVDNIYNNIHKSGEFNYKWEKGLNNSNLASGVYFLRIDLNGSLHTQKLLFK